MTTHPLVSWLGAGFSSELIRANGIAIHHVHGGQGPPVLLLHGFPQDCFEWRHVMRALADRFTVHAVDLRGVGLSEAPVDGYDAPSLADDIGALIGALKLGRVHIVGHDIGGWVAYALAIGHSALVRSAVIIECLLPGIEPADAPSPDVPMWHIGFHLVPGLAEILVSGNERAYFGHFLTTGTARADTINDNEIAHYAQAYRGDARLRAAMEVYRALPQNIAFNTTSSSDGTIPLLLVGGEQCFGPSIKPLADHLRRHHGWTTIDTATVEGARHYLPDENPDAVAELISRRASSP